MEELWIRTNIKQVGTRLIATAYVNHGLDNDIFTLSIDLKPIADKLLAFHKKLHEEKIEGCVGCNEVGFWGLGKVVKKIVKTAKKVGRVKLLKKVVHTAKWASPHYTAYKLATSARTRRLALRHAKRGGKIAKTVLRSKYTAAVIGAAAIAFPPVGAPALAAYASANAALSAIENGNKIASKVKSLVSSSKKVNKVKKAIRGKTLASVQATLRANPARTSALRKALAAKWRLRTISRNNKLKAQLRSAQRRKVKATKTIRKVANASRYAVSPAKRIQAQKASAVLVAVARNRARLQAIKAQKVAAQRGQPGVLITSRGPIRGVYRKIPRVVNTPDLLMLAHHSEPGVFEKIGGCIGCGIFNV